jgi:hypothetical protein
LIFGSKVRELYKMVAEVMKSGNVVQRGQMRGMIEELFEEVTGIRAREQAAKEAADEKSA